MIPERLPWHGPQWLRIERSIRSGRMPHAILLRGARGNGKAMFASRLAAELLCGSNAPPCETCASCRLCAAGSHPDWIEVTLEPDRREIVVEQIRDLVHSVGLTARFGRYKVVIVNPADLMNRHAANTILKTLEEPPGATVFVLVSSNPAQLPATIRSRCQMVDFPLPDSGLATEWLHGKVPEPDAALALAHGAPVRAVELWSSGLIEVRSRLDRDLDELLGGGDPTAVAARWKEFGRATVAWWLTEILADRLRKSVNMSTNPVPGAHGTRQVSCLLPMLDRCLEVRSGVLGRTNANEQLVLERLAFGIARESARSRGCRSVGSTSR